MAEMIGGQGQFETIFGNLMAKISPTGIINHDIQPVISALDLISNRSNFLNPGKVTNE